MRLISKDIENIVLSFISSQQSQPKGLKFVKISWSPSIELKTLIMMVTLKINMLALLQLQPVLSVMMFGVWFFFNPTNNIAS